MMSRSRSQGTEVTIVTGAFSHGKSAVTMFRFVFFVVVVFFSLLITICITTVVQIPWLI